MGNTTPKILMVTYGSVRDVTRILNEGKALVEAGYHITVLGAPREGFQSIPASETLQGMDILLMPLITRIHPVELFGAFWRLLRADIGQTTAVMPKGRSSIRTSINIVLFNLWLLRIGWRFKVTIIHCHEIWPLFAAWMLSRSRSALIYDSWESAPNLYPGGFRKALVIRLEKWLIRKVDKVITVGERLKRELLSAGAKQVEIVGNWKQLSAFEASPEKVSEVKSRLNLIPDQLVILYIGFLFPHREILPLLEAVKQSPDVVLLIGGRGDLENEVIDASKTSSNIIWLGWVQQEEVPVYTAIADVIYCCLDPNVSATYYAMPNKIFEAFAGGKVMLARKDVGEFGEVLENTQTGYLINNVQPDTLLEAFERLKKPDLMHQLQQNILKVRDQYDWPIAEKRLLELYADLLGKKPESR